MPEAAAATDPVLRASLAAVERSALCIRENGQRCCCARRRRCWQPQLLPLIPLGIVTVSQFELIFGCGRLPRLTLDFIRRWSSDFIVRITAGYPSAAFPSFHLSWLPSRAAPLRCINHARGKYSALHRRIFFSGSLLVIVQHLGAAPAAKADQIRIKNSTLSSHVCTLFTTQCWLVNAQLHALLIFMRIMHKQPQADCCSRS